MVSGADLFVDAIAGFHDALAALQSFRLLETEATLPRQHAFAVSDDDLETAFGGAHRLFERLDHRGDAVGAHRAQPLHAERAHGLFDADAGRGAGAIGSTRRQI